jgi:hypothetical protein
MSPEPREPFPPLESRHSRRRERARKKGLCVKCCVREAAPFVTQCVRCQRYCAEYKWLGFSTIPLGRGTYG